MPRSVKKNRHSKKRSPQKNKRSKKRSVKKNKRSASRCAQKRSPKNKRMTRSKNKKRTYRMGIQMDDISPGTIRIKIVTEVGTRHPIFIQRNAFVSELYRKARVELGRDVLLKNLGGADIRQDPDQPLPFYNIIDGIEITAHELPWVQRVDVQNMAGDVLTVERLSRHATVAELKQRLKQLDHDLHVRGQRLFIANGNDTVVLENNRRLASYWITNDDVILIMMLPIVEIRIRYTDQGGRGVQLLILYIGTDDTVGDIRVQLDERGVRRRTDQYKLFRGDGRELRDGDGIQNGSELILRDINADARLGHLNAD